MKTRLVTRGVGRLDAFRRVCVTERLSDSNPDSPAHHHEGPSPANIRPLGSLRTREQPPERVDRAQESLRGTRLVKSYGVPAWEGGSDEGYFSDEDLGLFESAEGGKAVGTLETVVFGTEAEAAAIDGLLSGSEAAAAAAIWGGSTITAGSLLAMFWESVRGGKELPAAQAMPSDRIQTVTKTRTKTTSKRPKPPPPPLLVPRSRAARSRTGKMVRPDTHLDHYPALRNG